MSCLIIGRQNRRKLFGYIRNKLKRLRRRGIVFIENTKKNELLVKQLEGYGMLKMACLWVPYEDGTACTYKLVDGRWTENQFWACEYSEPKNQIEVIPNWDCVDLVEAVFKD
jgi:hypothetical protein